MDPVHKHGHSTERPEIVSQEEYVHTAVYTAVALQSIHLFQSLVQKYCFLRLPTPVCIYSYILLQVYIEKI